MIELARKKIDDTIEIEHSLVSVTEKGEPVLLEIFGASKFFAEESKVLPKEIPPSLKLRPSARRSQPTARRSRRG